MKSHQLEEIKRVKWSKRRQNTEINGKITIIKHNRSGIVRGWTRKKKIDQRFDTYETIQVKHAHTTKGPFPSDER